MTRPDQGAGGHADRASAASSLRVAHLRQSKCPRIVNRLHEALGATATTPLCRREAGVTGLTAHSPLNAAQRGHHGELICPGPIRTRDYRADLLRSTRPLCPAPHRTCCYGYPRKSPHMIDLCLPCAAFLTRRGIPLNGGLIGAECVSVYPGAAHHEMLRC